MVELVDGSLVNREKGEMGVVYNGKGDEGLDCKGPIMAVNQY